MVKSVIKEIFIILLVSIAILLVLAIIFYDYIPINTYIPMAEEYSTPNNVLEELSDYITESEKIEVTYEVTDSDLNLYKQSGSYTEGKANPFALEETVGNTTEDEEETNTENSNDVTNNAQTTNSATITNSTTIRQNTTTNTSTNTATNTTTNTATNTSTSGNSTGTFFEDEVK